MKSIARYYYMILYAKKYCQILLYDVTAKKYCMILLYDVTTKNYTDIMRNI